MCYPLNGPSRNSSSSTFFGGLIKEVGVLGVGDLRRLRGGGRDGALRADLQVQALPLHLATGQEHHGDLSHGLVEPPDARLVRREHRARGAQQLAGAASLLGAVAEDLVQVGEPMELTRLLS